jgi:hypothetical protein
MGVDPGKVRLDDADAFTLLDAGLSAEFIRLGLPGSRFELLRKGLIIAGVIQDSESLVGLRDKSEWHRGGAQTFIADSVVIVAGDSGVQDPGHERQVIAKALISFGSPPGMLMASWLERRETLAALGIPVPQLFGAVSGTIFEEFIEDDLSPKSFLTPGMAEELGRIAAVLDAAGFATLSFLADLRRRGTTLYYVDFGADLGSPGDVRSSNARRELELKLPRASRDLALRSYTSYQIQ